MRPRGDLPILKALRAKARIALAVEMKIPSPQVFEFWRKLRKLFELPPSLVERYFGKRDQSLAEGFKKFASSAMKLSTWRMIHG
jgi:hypothetical protein